MTIEEMSLKAYPDNKVRLQKVCYGEIQRQAYLKGARAVLEEIEKAWNSSSIGFIAEMAVIDKIKELKKG